MYGVHLKVYKWKMIMQLNFEMYRPFIPYISQEIQLTLSRFTGSLEKNSTLWRILIKNWRKLVCSRNGDSPKDDDHYKGADNLGDDEQLLEGN